MQLIDDSAISRGMIRVESGEDLVESLQVLARAAGWRDAVITGAGSLELVELLLPDGTTVTLENAELASLAGRVHRGPDGQPLISLRASVTSANGVRCGRITGAMTGGLLLVVDAVTDQPARRAAVSERPPSTTDRSPTSPAATPPVVPGPARAPVLEGERSATKPLSQSFSTKPIVRPIAGPVLDLDDDEHENPMVNTGDYVNHPQLGLCEVVGEDNSGATKIRVGGGKTRSLRLEALEVLPGVEDEEGRMVFKVTGPRRR